MTATQETKKIVDKPAKFAYLGDEHEEPIRFTLASGSLAEMQVLLIRKVSDLAEEPYKFCIMIRGNPETGFYELVQEDLVMLNYYQRLAKNLPTYKKGDKE